MIIRKYQTNERFKTFVTKDLGINDSYTALNKKKVSTLNDLLNRIRVNLDNRNADKMIDSCSKNVCVVYETVMSEFYDIDGFTDNLFSQDNFLDCLEKMKIETRVPQIPAPIQMGFMIVQTTLMTHEMNKMKVPSSHMMPPEDLLILDNDDK